MMSRLYILHENGAPRHFESLFHLNKEQGLYDEIVQVEFTFLRQLIKGIVRRRPEFLLKGIKNFWVILTLIFSKNKHLIIGAAPYDAFIYLLYILKLNHQVTYYSSWPYWNKERYPKKIRSNLQFRLWEKFLEDINVVGVTDHVTRGLSNYTSSTTVIPHCVDPNIFRYQESSKDRTVFRVLYVGRLIQDKGIRDIIEMINSLKRERNLEWWFVGSGELSKEIEEISQSSSNVKFFGQIKEQAKLSEIYNACDVLLLPSKPSSNWEELFGIVIIEAMSCGVIPISSDAVGPRTIIEHGKNGYILSSPMVVEDALNLILEVKNNAKLWEQLSYEALKTVTQKYTIDITSDLWSIALNKLHSELNAHKNYKQSKLGG
ncbi:glycosyltransferase family 4 protein [Paenibacillus sp. 453mf]|uniref:glycosyltransferase family 4 protein n=1 Tax=Paenibacillus sp. 453mf TaxID=1761874 RepID=UPI0008E3EAED|nr:glycosyltransferase family 4 protein [Paenibacillus sp. 453mf]SFS38928.1 Glycosyltransferase involved in cell wall bisynthesis [Paenibacillus sp. 453mf]